MFYKVKKEALFAFLLDFSSKHGIEILVPITDSNTNIIRYACLSPDTIDKIVLKMTMVPPTHYILQKYNVLFYFNSNEIIKPTLPTKPTLIFMPYSDIIAFYILDKIFFDEPLDDHYKQIRDNIILVEFEEEEEDEHTFTQHIFNNDNHDIKIIGLEDCFILHIRTEKAKILLDKELMQKYDIQPEEHTPKERLLIRTFLTNIKLKEGKDNEGKDINDKVFSKYASKCIGCGACTLLCPTCNCFIIKDVIDSLSISPWSGQSKKEDKSHNNIVLQGRRIIVQDSCQFLDYYRIAGDYYFVKTIAERIKHRIYHKFKYFKQKYGITMCTGCGRCTRYCPANIKLVSILKEIKE